MTSGVDSSNVGFVNRDLLVTCAALACLLAACSSIREVWPTDPGDVGCPNSVEAARAVTLGDNAFVATGYVIRFVPSPDEAFRGYDLDVTRVFTGPAFRDVGFLRIEDEIAGMSQGDPVLVVAERTDKARVFVPGPCPPLVRVPAEDVEP
ncbi:MAG TPA: hypothetical protein VFV59_07210 [Candidatus Limnocylindria bacterium]|nr:hypothetical protein [Candidatus Limnocylindria bacterium]